MKGGATGTNPDAVGTSDRSNTTQTQSKTEGQGCDMRGRASGMLRARGTRPDSGSDLHSAGLTLEAGEFTSGFSG